MPEIVVSSKKSKKLRAVVCVKSSSTQETTASQIVSAETNGKQHKLYIPIFPPWYVLPGRQVDADATFFRLIQDESCIYILIFRKHLIRSSRKLLEQEFGFHTLREHCLKPSESSGQ